jgi:acyl-CoA reductase-like NAD-dependent aldehyde dehydrogenase
MEKLTVANAYDESPIEEIPLKSEEEVMNALETAHRLYQNRSKWLPANKRIAILERALEIIKSRKEELIACSVKEGGKPLQDSVIEIERGIEGIKIALKEMLHLKGEEIPMGLTDSSRNRLAVTIREPRGVVLAISAFNHPFNLIIHQVIPAIAVGCPVLIKPASTTPLSCRNIISILYQAGLPQEWCQMIACKSRIADKIVSDPRIGFLSFIGSGEVGWHLRSKLAPGASCALEHGGLAPVIFDETADIDKYLPGLIKGGYYHAGQVCVSVQRIYVQESICDRFVEAFVKRVRNLKVGDPLDKDTEVGPLIVPQEVDRVHEWTQEAVKHGGKILCGGEKISNTCYAPTVIFNPSDDAKLSQLEIFGPVVAIYPYKDRDEAIRRANRPDVSFQASIFTENLDVALDSAKKLKGLAIMINDHTAFRVDWMPFGGHRQSGLAVGGIGYSMKDMTIEKMIVFKSDAL